MVYERTELGDFSSVVCFKAVIVGVEDTLGVDGAGVVFTRAGKVRGKDLVESLGLTGKNLPVEDLAKALNDALGQPGTRLCAVKSATQEDDKIIVRTAETVCSAGEEMGSERKCTFTLGAIWGALEAVTGETYLGEHTGSVLRGDDADVFEYTRL